MSIRLTPYVVTNGNGKEAIAFYEEALSAKVLGVMTFGESPQDPDHPFPEEAKDRIMHALLQVGDSQLMLSDTFPGMPFQTGNNFSVAIVVDSPEKAREIFDKLSVGGQVKMPLQATFWSPAYGALTDKYGVQFQISTEPAK